MPERQRPAEMGTGSVLVEGPGGVVAGRAERSFRSMPGAPVEDLSMEAAGSPFAQSPIMPSEMRLLPDLAPAPNVSNMPQDLSEDISLEVSETPLAQTIIMPSEMPPALDMQPAPVQIVTNGSRQPSGIATASNAQPIETLPDAYAGDDLSKDLVIS